MVTEQSCRCAWRRSPAGIAALLLTILALSPLQAQIGFLQLQPDGNLQMRRVNANGSGELAIGLPFTTVGFPVFSRDGSQLAVTASDPALPNERSQNIFSLSLTTGAVNELTFYGDLFDPRTGTVIYNFPNYKAFSPDNSQLAVFTYLFTGSTDDVGTQTTTPSLEVYRLDRAAAPLQVHVDKGVNGTHHGGEGVDWSPATNVLVAPLEGTAPFVSGGGPGEVTTLNLIEPSAGAVVAGHFQQITFPRADGHVGIGSGDAYLSGEHDYAPKFSPNGRGVAFVRSFQNFFTLSRPTPDPYIQSLHVVDVTTLVDTQIATFAAGAYITTVDWSPDGTQLIFDIGQQATGPLGPLHSAVAETVEIDAINVDGTGLKRLRGPGMSSPTWSRTDLPAPLAPNLGNISTRISVGTGDNVLIGGFIITGEGDKNVIVRAIGPSLGEAGVAGALADPILELHNASGAIIATNDNWKATQQSAIEASTVPPTNDKESAIVKRLTPGNYTAVVRGKNRGTGVGLVEAYGLDGTAKLANISTRGLVQTGDNVMIGGFIILNAGIPTDVIVRAIGPSLTGVNNALADPTLELRDGNGALIASNDDWKETQKSAIVATTVAPTKDKESAIVRTLGAGNYTAVVRGKNNATGVALVEAYNLQ